MNIEDIQPWIAELLVAHPGLAAATVLLDDGTYPKTPGREAALGSQGVCLTVWQIESGGLLDSTQRGSAVEVLNLAIVIEENAAVNRGTGGLQLRAEKALRLVREALVGVKRSGEPGAVIRCDDPPFKNFGNRNGVQCLVALFLLDLPITPV